MYAIVSTGGKQYKVAEGDVLEIEKLDAAAGDAVALPAILLVDGEDVTHDADALAKVAVTAEVLAQTKGPKIRIHKFKNKTGYHKRMGHRQQLTQVQVTEISAGTTKKAAKKSSATAESKTSATAESKTSAKAESKTDSKPAADTATDEKE